MGAKRNLGVFAIGVGLSAPGTQAGSGTLSWMLRFSGQIAVATNLVLAVHVLILPGPEDLQRPHDL